MTKEEILNEISKHMESAYQLYRQLYPECNYLTMGVNAYHGKKEDDFYSISGAITEERTEEEGGMFEAFKPEYVDRKVGDE